MMLMLYEYEENLRNVQHLQYVHEDRNQVNVWVNNVLMDVPVFNRKKKDFIKIREKMYIYLYAIFFT
jgi:hypothetical protein